MNFIITKQQAEAILNYLVTKPFLEVHEGVAILRGLKPVIAQSAEKITEAAKTDLKNAASDAKKTAQTEKTAVAPKPKQAKGSDLKAV